MTDIVASEVDAMLRLYAHDDCDGVDLPTHACNVAADFVAAQADTIATLQAKLDKAVEGLGRQAEGWSNALELDIISERHRTSAKLLADEAQSLIKEVQP